jgi:arginine exporter protein ArgO
MRTRQDLCRGLLWFCALGLLGTASLSVYHGEHLRAVLDLAGSAVMFFCAVTRQHPCPQDLLNPTR